MAFGAGVGLLEPAAAQLLVVSQNSAEILEYDEDDGSFVRVFVEAVDDGFQNPGGIAIHPGNGALYVTSTGTGEIWEYDVGTGDAVTPAAAAGLIQPAAAAFDASGSTLYFVAANGELSVTNDAVKALTISSGNISTVTTDASANFSALVVDGSQLFVTDSLTGSVVRVPLAGGSDTTVIGFRSRRVTRERWSQWSVGPCVGTRWAAHSRGLAFEPSGRRAPRNAGRFAARRVGRWRPCRCWWCGVGREHLAPGQSIFQFGDPI